MGSVKILLFDFDAFLKNVYRWRCLGSLIKLICAICQINQALPFWFRFQQLIRHDKISKKASVIFLVSKNVTVSAFDDRSVKVRTYKSYLAIALEL
ncbi:hypothetical protein A4S05_19190 [Nostoc sp. KVJ20]|nr:hypothetical protein A4S05_19190 [Nostoc sp. KVJ20]